MYAAEAFAAQIAPAPVRRTTARISDTSGAAPARAGASRSSADEAISTAASAKPSAAWRCEPSPVLRR